jgi:asparagine synthase (glutamine-hydrolysing)
LTFFENIHKLPPASYLIYDGKSFFVKRYFDILDISTQIYDKKMALDEIELALIDSISNRLSSSREIGSLLSGGIDSSLICSIVSKEFGKSLKTFSIGYDGFEKYDERGYAKLVAESINSEHYEFNFTYDNFLEYINSTLYALDEPINDPASIPLHFLFKSVKTSGIDVLLSGEGSDELFFGYRQYFEFFDIEKLSNLKFKNWLNGYFKKNFSLNREWEWYKRIFEGSYLFRSSAENFTDLQKAILLQRDIKDNSSLKYIEPYIKEFEESIFKGDALSWYSYIDLKVLVNDIYLAKVDRVSMSNTLEVRTPFLDHNLVQKVLSIDSKLRLGDRTKTLLKDISSKYLPDIIINRKKKGFSYPFLEWLYMAGEIDRISQINKKTDIFNSDKLKFLLESGKKGKFKQHIFGIYLFSIFFEKEFL